MSEVAFVGWPDYGLFLPTRDRFVGSFWLLLDSGTLLDRWRWKNRYISSDYVEFSACKRFLPNFLGTGKFGSMMGITRDDFIPEIYRFVAFRL